MLDICSCQTYYYGNNCELEVPDKEKVEFIDGDINSAKLTGIILGWIFTIVVIWTPVFFIKSNNLLIWIQLFLLVL